MLDVLFQRHYQNQSTSSEVTSSHWQLYSKNPVTEVNGNIVLRRGIGFGDFRPATFVHQLRYFVQSLLLRKYLQRFCTNQVVVAAGMEIAQKSGRLLSFDCCKQMVIAEKLLSWNAAKGNVNVVCIIGDGYGFLGMLLKKLMPELKIISINLGKQLLYDAYFTNKIFLNNKCLLFKSEADFGQEFDFLFIEAENYHQLAKGNIDLFINIASMQEMNPEIVNNYFQNMRANKSENHNVYFYCCNREEKKLPDGTISALRDYPWKDAEIIFESFPEWYQKYPSHKPPFWHPFDGPMQERFVEF